jgi:hypothetical protein
MKLSSNAKPDNIFWMFSKTGQPNRSKISSHCPELKSKCSSSNGDQPGRTCSRSVTPSTATSLASVKRPTKSLWNWRTSHSDSHSWLNELALTDRRTTSNIASPKGTASLKASANTMAHAANWKTSFSEVRSALFLVIRPEPRPRPGSEQHYKPTPQETLTSCANPALR